MDDGFWITVVIFILVVSLAGGIVIHENLETPYDKCLDSCDNIYNNPVAEKECIFNCNENLCINKLKENGKE